ncbi:MAG: hypothetical protein QOH99_1017, partial [Frankiaceae bacterium]|nr:hypothetical protein [Frankiaceae bacterium]
TTASGDESKQHPKRRAQNGNNTRMIMPNPADKGLAEGPAIPAGDYPLGAGEAAGVGFDATGRGVFRSRSALRGRGRSCGRGRLSACGVVSAASTGRLATTASARTTRKTAHKTENNT